MYLDTRQEREPKTKVPPSTGAAGATNVAKRRSILPPRPGFSHGYQSFSDDLLEHYFLPEFAAVFASDIRSYHLSLRYDLRYSRNDMIPVFW